MQNTSQNTTTETMAIYHREIGDENTKVTYFLVPFKLTLKSTHCQFRLQICTRHAQTGACLEVPNGRHINYLKMREFIIH